VSDLVAYASNKDSITIEDGSGKKVAEVKKVLITLMLRIYWCEQNVLDSKW